MYARAGSSRLLQGLIALVVQTRREILELGQHRVDLGHRLIERQARVRLQHAQLVIHPLLETGELGWHAGRVVDLADILQGQRSRPAGLAANILRACDVARHDEGCRPADQVDLQGDSKRLTFDARAYGVGAVDRTVTRAGDL